MTFSEKLSQRIQELGIKIEDTGLWWIRFKDCKEWQIVYETKIGFVFSTGAEIEKLRETGAYFISVFHTDEYWEFT